MDTAPVSSVRADRWKVSELACLQGSAGILACFPHMVGQAWGALLAQYHSVITSRCADSTVSAGVNLLIIRKEAVDFPFRKTGTQRGKEPRVKK